MKKRKICVVTGGRAEYGLLCRLMKEIQTDETLQLQIIATGMHLSPEFGSTYRQIESDGFEISAKVEMLLSSDSPVGIAKSIGLGVSGFADALNQLQPDILVVLGDRFEILAAVQASMIARIPVAHIHGGESTLGAVDENMRHAITKMAQWHFVAAEAYRKRVVQLGEAPDRVFNVGAPGLDHFQDVNWLDKPALERELGISLDSPVFLVTYHPETLGKRTPLEGMNELLAALDVFPDARIIFTYPNSDAGGRILIARINEWVSANQSRARAFISLGQEKYLSLLKIIDAMIGNSSSGLIEAPVLKTAAINIGDRQKGRLKALSVIDAANDRNAIINAIQQVLSEKFRKELPSIASHYGTGGASRKIKDILKLISIETQKCFFDIQHAN
jgi:UDP-hydrolysing UDP-N-acetyl-D-glucosamine 2-epimerase